MKQYWKAPELLDRKEPAELGLVYTSVRRLEVGPEPVTVESGDEEMCFFCIAGSAAYTCGAHTGEAVLLDQLYLPAHASMTLTSARGGVLMQYGAPCARPTSFGHIRFADVDKDDRHKVYGKVENGTRRDVWNYIDEKFDSSRFLTGICRGTDGGWTAWPPHEHGKEREETYVYFNMGKGFAAQFVYDDMDEPAVVALVREGDVVTIPHGYHPNVGCPCGGIFYAYVMVSTTADDRNFMDLRTQKIYGDKLE